MKNNFVTGLIILLPLAVTLAIVLFILNVLTGPFTGLFESFLADASWYPKYYWVIHFVIQIFLLVILFLFTVLLGFLAKVLVFKSFLNVYEYLIHKIPLINTLYKTSKQLIGTIFGSSSKSFKQVVMVPFPRENSYCIGFISSEAPSICSEAIQQELFSVFVPTTPNPTSGFLMMYRKEDLIFLNMKVEEAFKMIISCGVVVNGAEVKIQGSTNSLPKP